MTNDRRTFFRAAVGGMLGLAGSASLLEASVGEAWLDDIARRRHRAFLDVGTFSLDGAPFRRAGSLFTSLEESYGAKRDEIGVAFGVHGDALGYVMRPDVWKRLQLADFIASRAGGDAAAQLRADPARFAALGQDRVREARARGMRVLACRNSITRWAAGLSSARGIAAADLVTTLSAGMHEGVELVPAMIAAAVLAQARNVAYVSLT